MPYTPSYPGQDVATLTALTLEKYKTELIDSASKDYATYFLLTGNGRVDYEDGGTSITEPLMYDFNNTIGSYVAGQSFSLERPSGFTRLNYKWGYAAGNILIDGPSEWENSGRNGIVNLASAFVEQFRISVSRYMNGILLGDGTGNFGADMHGLLLLVEDGTAGGWSTVGNINSSTNTWWRNYWLNGSGTAWGPVADGLNTYGLQQIRYMLRKCTVPGFGMPDVLLTSLDQYQIAERCIAVKTTFDMPSLYNQKYVEVGFGGLRAFGVPMVYDMNLDDMTTAQGSDDWLALNTKAFRLVIGKNKAFAVDPPVPHPWMDAKIMLAKMYGQITMLGRRDSCGRLRLAATMA